MKKFLFGAIGLILICILAAWDFQGYNNGDANGKLIVDDEPTTLFYAYAKAIPGFFDKDKEDIVVILTNIQIPHTALVDDFERMEMENLGTLRCVEMTINSDLKPISVKIRHNVFEASPGGMSTDYVFEPGIVDENSIEGKMFCKREKEFFGVTYTFNAKFKAAIWRKPVDPPLSDADKQIATMSEQAQVYREYEEAILNEDLETLKKLAAAEVAPELDDPDIKQMLGFWKDFLPKEVEFLKLTVTESTAILKAKGNIDGQHQEGFIEFIFENGEWKVLRSNW